MTKQKIELAGKEVLVDSRIWQIFENKAGDRKLSLLTLASEYFKDNKSAERALADALHTFNKI